MKKLYWILREKIDLKKSPRRLKKSKLNLQQVNELHETEKRALMREIERCLITVVPIRECAIYVDRIKLSVSPNINKKDLKLLKGIISSYPHVKLYLKYGAEKDIIP